jgi:hypothetical protein
MYSVVIPIAIVNVSVALYVKTLFSADSVCLIFKGPGNIVRLI